MNLVAKFANFSATYGSIGAVIVLMMWLYLTGLVILIGADIDSLAEREVSPRAIGRQ